MNWTNEQVAAYEARRAICTPAIGRQIKANIKREIVLHRQIFEECKRRGWLVFHGSMAHSTHRNLGEPDMIICMDFGRMLFCECKAPGRKLSVDQQAIGAWLRKLDHKFACVYSFDDFLELIRIRKLQ